MRRLLTAVPGQDAVDARLLELQSAENELGALDAELRLIDEQLVAAEQEKTASKEGRIEPQPFTTYVGTTPRRSETRELVFNHVQWHLEEVEHRIERCEELLEKCARFGEIESADTLR